MERGTARLALLLLLAGCQPQARRALVLDLALSEPALVDGTSRPWHDAGFSIEYRRFYPHLTRTDLARYRVLLFLLGREPQVPSDALTSGDVQLLDEWVKRGGVVVLGYDGDGEGSLDRATVNRWLASEGAGIAIEARVLDDSTGRGRLPRLPLWVEGSRLGDHPLGSIYDSFPLGRNHLLEVRRSSEILAGAIHRLPARGGKPERRAFAGPVAAASRVGDGLVVVISRYALGALGPQYRAPATLILDADALADTRRFLTGLARWVRRPAEWAHVPPAERRGLLASVGLALEAGLQPPPLEPPSGDSATVALPLVPGTPTPLATGIPDWIREVGVRALWTPLLVTRGGSEMPRSPAALDSLVRSLDEAGFNLLIGDAAAETVADSMHHYWEDRAAVRRAWREVVNVLQPTSVAWIPAIVYRRATRGTADSSRGSPRACVLDSAVWEGRLVPAFVTLARLATGLRQLIPAVALDLDSVPGMRAGDYVIGQEFCDAAWQRVLARMGPAPLRDSIAPPDRLEALRESGLVGSYYATLQDIVAERARTLRDRVLRERPGLNFAFRFGAAPGDWLSLALLRGFSLPERPLIVLTPDPMTRDVLAEYGAQGVNAVHAVELSPLAGRGQSVAVLKHAIFGENDGFWVSAGAGAAGDSLGQVLRRLTR
jgi:hypothetical protein